MKNKGLHQHRFRDNPEERRFAQAWEDRNVYGQNLDYLLDTGPGRGSLHPPPASDRDRVVAATVIQWLGSPVGQGFLQDLGYEKK